VAGAEGVMDALVHRINVDGPVPFSVFMDAALYGPTGFYTRGGGAGRRRDFITSPETGELFGKVIARALDTWWVEQGGPDPFIVAECGAGPGALARSVFRAAPQCASALRYLLVERSAVLRERHRTGRLPLVDVAQVLGGFVVASDASDVGAVAFAGQGPLFASVEEIPAVGMHIVLANEMLDNLPFDVFERVAQGWAEVRVGLGDSGFGEVLVVADPAIAARLDALVPHAESTFVPGRRVPWMGSARTWLAEALSGLSEGGRIVCLDYARYGTSDFLVEPWQAWLRTYRGHGRGGHPLDAPGTQDVTTDVAVDQLAGVRRPISERAQADFLRGHGVDDVVAAAAWHWSDVSGTPTLGDLSARSLVTEAKALLDPAGLGGFTVLEWQI
jgi:SAM-dependent MidA family methyltransferase